MSKAEELLDSLSIEDIQPFTSQPDIEGHIVIDKDRIIHVPTELKRIAVQYDANIETVTFDCPRYWDEHDLSEMNIYINYKLPGNLINNVGQSLAKNLRINEDDENIINFDWTIGPILTNNKGDLPFSVCAKSKTNQDSDEAIRWYTEINTELTISEGMDGSGDIEDNYEDLFPDIINDIITKLDGINTTYDEKLDAFNANAASKTESFDTNAETRTTEFNDNAAQKTLDYNNNCTSKTDSFNQNSTQKVTEFNDNYTSKLNSFNSNADSRIEEFDTHADLALSSIPKQEAEGTDNVFNDGLKSPLYDLAGDGKSEQVVTTGKNNLNNTLISQTLNGLNIQINEDKSVKIQGTANKDTNIILNRKPEINTGTYTLYGCKTFIESEENNGWWNAENEPVTKTFTTKPILSSQGFFIYIENGQAINKTYYPMLLKGTYTNENIGDYEPYTGGQPSPSPDYPQEINSIEGSLEFACRGKNYLNIEDGSQTINGVTVTKNNGKITVNGTATNTCFFPISKSIDNFRPGKYVLSANNSKTLNNNQNLLRIMKEDNIGYLDSTITNFSKINNTAIFNITSADDVNNGYLLLRIETGTVLANFVFYPQLEPGSQATEPEPYVEPNKVTFNLNDEKLRSVGDVKDELVVDLDTGDYYKVENVGEEIFDGVNKKTYYKNTSVTSDTKGFYLLGLQNKNKNFSNGYTEATLCNYFKAVSGTAQSAFDSNTDGLWWEGSSEACYLIIEKTTIEDVNTWFSEHNTIIDYPLATPTTKKLGTLSSEDLAKLKTFKGYNNVTVNTNLGLMNIRFTYGLDIKKYVDNKIAELSAQMIKGE